MDFHKTHSIEVKFVTGLQNILFASMCVHFFSPEIVRAGAMKGLINTQRYTESHHTVQ